MGSKTKFLGCVALAGLCALAVVHLASASPPPPPRFYDFTMSNTTGVMVENISVELHFADPATNYSTLDPAPIVINISKLPNGKEIVLGSGTLTKGLYGVAKIVVRAECPGGQTLQAPAEITASKGQYEPATPLEEYSGFCEDAPPNEVDYAPRLSFSRNAAGQFEAVLAAKCRWNLYWSPLIADTKPFGP